VVAAFSTLGNLGEKRLPPVLVARRCIVDHIIALAVAPYMAEIEPMPNFMRSITAKIKWLFGCPSCPEGCEVDGDAICCSSFLIRSTGICREPKESEVSFAYVTNSNVKESIPIPSICTVLAAKLHVLVVIALLLQYKRSVRFPSRDTFRRLPLGSTPSPEKVDLCVAGSIPLDIGNALDILISSIEVSVQGLDLAIDLLFADVFNLSLVGDVEDDWDSHRSFAKGTTFSKRHVGLRDRLLIYSI
jgi:hypothetical protein